MLDLPMPPKWTEQAICASTDPEAFFPDKGGSDHVAISVCRRCPVASECLDYAVLHNEIHGVWGGVAAKARRGLGRAA